MTQVASRRRATPTALALAFLAALATASAPVAQPLQGGVVQNDTATTTTKAAGGQCGDDTAYNKLYGVQGVMLTQDQADAATGNPGVFRCGGCDKPNMEECWLKPRAEPPPVAVVAQALQGSAQRTYNNGGTSDGYSTYPPPTMVGAAQRTAAPTTANRTSNRTVKRTTGAKRPAPTDTVNIKADGWPVSVDIPRNLALNKPFTAALSKPAKSDSPWTTAQIILLQRKSATLPGIVQFINLYQGATRYPEDFKATF